MRQVSLGVPGGAARGRLAPIVPIMNYKALVIRARSQMVLYFATDGLLSRLKYRMFGEEAK